MVRERSVFFFDFDGTLAPITALPENARLSARLKELIQSLARKHTVIVVSGRALADIRERVGLDEIGYAGNHGFEWQVRGRRGHVRLSPSTLRDLDAVRRELRRIANTFSGAIFEDKAFTLSLHYRLVASDRASAMLELITERLGPLIKSGRIRLTQGKKVLEVRPSVVWHKGDFARMMLRRFRERPHTVVFCGDDTTDEDAFRSLPRDITIKVGPNKETAAKYYLPRRTDVDRFLEAITLKQR